MYITSALGLRGSSRTTMEYHAHPTLENVVLEDGIQALTNFL
jgi:hypothetical protein